jgi:basic membrane lipoprotein Med (substrate-binding protein (PBP1-ABC) superfamily)
MTPRIAWRIALALLVTAMAAFVVACGGDDEGGSSTAPAEPAATQGASDQPKADYKVAVLSIGTETDRSWAQGNFDGGKQAADKYGAQVTIVPNIFTPEQYVQQGGAFARRGYDMVLLQFGVATQPAVQLATQFPDTLFGVVWDPTEEETASLPPNLFTWDPQQQEGAFLAGALSSLVTKSNVLGSVSGTPFPLITRQLEGYELGARCVNPDIKVLQRYTGDATFADAGLARSAAEALISDGADILYTALDGAVNGVYQAAKSNQGTFAIAQYFDQAPKAPDVILSSVLFNLQGINEDMIKRGMDGQIGEREHLVYDLASLDVGELTGFGQLDAAVSADAKKQLDEIEQKIRSGDIKVPDNDALAKPGAAAKIDPKSLGC